MIKHNGILYKEAISGEFKDESPPNYIRIAVKEDAEGNIYLYRTSCVGSYGNPIGKLWNYG